VCVCVCACVCVCERDYMDRDAEDVYWCVVAWRSQLNSTHAGDSTMATRRLSHPASSAAGHPAACVRIAIHQNTFRATFYYEFCRPRSFFFDRTNEKICVGRCASGRTSYRRQRVLHRTFTAV